MTEKSINDDSLRKISALNGIAKKRGQSLAQMALAWVYNSRAVTSVLIGASKAEQIAENVKMLDNTSFTDEELKMIDSCIK